MRVLNGGRSAAGVPFMVIDEMPAMEHAMTMHHSGVYLAIAEGVMYSFVDDHMASEGPVAFPLDGDVVQLRRHRQAFTSELRDRWPEWRPHAMRMRVGDHDHNLHVTGGLFDSVMSRFGTARERAERILPLVGSRTALGGARARGALLGYRAGLYWAENGTERFLGKPANLRNSPRPLLADGDVRIELFPDKFQAFFAGEAEQLSHMTTRRPQVVDAVYENAVIRVIDELQQQHPDPQLHVPGGMSL